MADLDLAREHMEIIGSDGQHIGALLRMQEGALLLAGGEPENAPRLPLILVDTIDTVIRLNAPARDVIGKWLRARPDAFDSAPTSG